ncbi:unnamed protein product [Amoebophrya sp. A25]|nr:unnamed protein product [Amoebophrya sp. A25]|eukprot:GSA25T00005676001.1
MSCSAGIGPNFSMAKMASNVNKPNGQFCSCLFNDVAKNLLASSGASSQSSSNWHMRRFLSSKAQESEKFFKVDHFDDREGIGKGENTTVNMLRTGGHTSISEQERGTNASMAKTGASFKTPEAFAEKLRQEYTPAGVAKSVWLLTLPARAWPGVGPVATRLLERYRIQTIGDVHAHRGMLWRLFSPAIAQLLVLAASGLEKRKNTGPGGTGGRNFSASTAALGASNKDQPYNPFAEVSVGGINLANTARHKQSLSQERSFGREVSDLATVQQRVKQLSARVAEELRDAKLVGRTVTLRLKRAKTFDYKAWSQPMVAPLASTTQHGGNTGNKSGTSTATSSNLSSLYSGACAQINEAANAILLKSAWPTCPHGVWLVGVTVSNCRLVADLAIEEEAARPKQIQPSIKDIFGITANSKKEPVVQTPRKNNGKEQQVIVLDDSDEEEKPSPAPTSSGEEGRREKTSIALEKDVVSGARPTGESPMINREGSDEVRDDSMQKVGEQDENADFAESREELGRGNSSLCSRLWQLDSDDEEELKKRTGADQSTAERGTPYISGAKATFASSFDLQAFVKTIIDFRRRTGKSPGAEEKRAASETNASSRAAYIRENPATANVEGNELKKHRTDHDLDEEVCEFEHDDSAFGGELVSGFDCDDLF